MYLIDKHYNFGSFFYLLHYRFYPLLELTSVFRSGYHHGKVKYHKSLPFQYLRNVPHYYLLRKTLYYRGLTDSCFTDKNRIVLLSSCKYLHHTLYFFISAYDGVQLFLLGHFRKISSKRIKCGCFCLFLRFSPGPCSIPRYRCAKKTKNFITYTAEIKPHIQKHLTGHPVALSNKPKKEMFCANIVMSQIPSLVHSKLYHFFCSGRKRNIVLHNFAGTGLYEFFNFHSYVFRIKPETCKNSCRHSLSFFYKTKKNMFGPYVIVVKPFCLFFCKKYYFSGSLSESVECRHLCSFILR